MTGRALLRRLGQMLFVLWVVTTFLFFLFRMMPGSPIAGYIDTSMTPEHQAILMHQFGLDRPLYEQYALYLFNLLQGSLGFSFIYKESVGSVLLTALPNTLLLTVTSLLIAYAFGILAGAFLAARRGTWIEAVSLPFVLATRALPEFWLGMVLLAVLSFSFGLFPAGGATSPGASFPNAFARYASLDFLHHLALPALTLAIFLQGLPLLLMRSNMLEVMQEEFVVMSRMKGLSEWSIIVRHAARNALLPVATALALGIGSSIGGNVVVESVFSWPGLGRRLVEAVSASDYPLAQGAFLMIAAAQVTMNCVADLLYATLDPPGQEALMSGTVIAAPPRNEAVVSLGRQVRDPWFVAGASIYLLFLLVALFADVIASNPPKDILFLADGRLAAALKSGWQFPLGTTTSGCDIFSQLIHGARSALVVGTSAAVVVVSVGTLIGLFAGYFGGWIDAVLMRLADIALGLPLLPSVIVLAAFLGPNTWNVVLAISVLLWPNSARIIRAQVMSLRERAYIEAARAAGSSDLSILFRHIAPSILPIALLFGSIAVGWAILTEASVSFLGFSDPNTTTWGFMLQDAYVSQALSRGLFNWFVPPGICIVMLVSAGLFISRGYEQLLFPRLRD